MAWEWLAVIAGLCPLACWALLTRTRVLGVIVAAVLAVGAGLAIAIAFGWWRPTARVGNWWKSDEPQG